MPLEWMHWDTIQRRSISTAYTYYENPERILAKITSGSWSYKTRRTFYHIRDTALMSLIYLTSARIGEVTRSYVTLVLERDPLQPKKVLKRQQAKTSSVMASQFQESPDGDLLLTRLPIHKRYVSTVKDYPSRDPIILPMTGDLARFTELIVDYLDLLKEGEELFKFLPQRAYTIIHHITGETCHWLRAMSLKMRLRLYGMNIAVVQRFSGHKTIEELLKYLQEAEEAFTVKQADFTKLRT